MSRHCVPGFALAVLACACGSEDAGEGPAEVGSDAAPTGVGGALGGGGVGGSRASGGSGGTVLDAGGPGGSVGSGGSVAACGGSNAATDAGPSGGTPGTWVNVSVPLSYSDCGAQTMVVNPVRPSDFYAFVCSSDNSAQIAILKSTDFGQTFMKINATSWAHNPTGGTIDPNPCRDPETPPTMYSPAFGGNLGLFKSTDGGVTWAQVFKQKLEDSFADGWGVYYPPSAYGVTVIPDNPPNHVLVTIHAGQCTPTGQPYDAGSPCPVAESTDGGVTWVEHAPPEGFGVSNYPVAIDAQTWLIVAEGDGIWRTTTAGRVGGVVSKSAWTKVSDVGHTHGSFQAYVTPTDVYVPGRGGIVRSKDRGATWTKVYDIGGNYVDSVIGTDKYLYANAFYNPSLKRATVAKGDDWADYTTKPASMTTGPAPFGAAASFDGTHWVILTADDDPGIFRYVEP